ncbi:DgyrCDS13395 [Dimorphilus gyrociliatus]|uniref:DgyrCDS13395 n=1 Tax=Dimorphilus gyrociliatus TaxID=2664684 RepID=A0A7I8WAI2_9ANNE|nr:DgyrCDS13395 [Dimorphilus gyrociliatus]
MIGLRYCLLQSFCAAIIFDAEWCERGSGPLKYNDVPFYISRTRDGGLWLRTGSEGHGDYSLHNLTHGKRLLQMISNDQTNAILTTNFSDSCVISDIQFSLIFTVSKIKSYIKVIDVISKTDDSIFFRPYRNCLPSKVTVVKLSDDKQNIYCTGRVRKNSCNSAGLPHFNQSRRSFVKTIGIDISNDHDKCNPAPIPSSITFLGDYYHAYIRIGECKKPKDLPQLGYEARLRAHADEESQKTILLTDPSQESLAESSQLDSWKIYVKTTSSQQSLHLQIWRPQKAGIYKLVSDTFVPFDRLDLRLQTIDVRQNDTIVKGDILGLFFSGGNPIGWDSVPCATEEQKYKYLRIKDKKQLRLGRSFKFHTARGRHACRHYSYVAVFANKKSLPIIEDWKCPGKKLNLEGKDLWRTSTSKDTQKKTVLHVHTDVRLSYSSTIPIYVILVIIGCLISLLIIVGVISYYRALKT